MTSRLLFTGARDWPQDRWGWTIMYWGIRGHVERLPGPVILVHGDADRADQMAKYIAHRLGIGAEGHPARRFRNPPIRNQHMVDLGAAACVACATRWASGTGQCARMARRAGIPVFDLGVDTRTEARPTVIRSGARRG